jgi:hypothetical protein
MRTRPAGTVIQLGVQGIIVSGGRGYRLSDKIVVREALPEGGS